jgi:hypothetical protein
MTPATMADVAAATTHAMQGKSWMPVIEDSVAG